MEEARRQILTLVARGELDPGEAADRLAELDTAPEPGPTPGPGPTPWPGPTSGPGPTPWASPIIPPDSASEHSDEAAQPADDQSSDISGRGGSAPPALARVRSCFPWSRTWPKTP